MGRQYQVKRKIANVPVTANGMATLDLPRVYDYNTIFMSIRGLVTVATAGTGVRAEAPSQIIQRCEITANGKNNLVSMPFSLLALGNVSRKGLQYGARVLTPPTSHTAATYAVAAIAAIDFANVGGVKPKDTAFRSAGLDLLQLRLTFGAAADLFTGNAVASFSNMYVEVYVAETVELPDQAGGVTPILGLKKTSYQEISVNSSNANQEIRLPAGNYIGQITIRAAEAGEPTTGIINNIQLASGLDVRFNLTGDQTRESNNSDYGAVTAGYYIVDLTANGPQRNKLTDTWDVTGSSEPKLVLDVTAGAASKLQIGVTEYIMSVTK